MANIVVVHGIRAAANEGNLHDTADCLRKAGHTVYEYAYPSRRAIEMYSSSVRLDDAKGLVLFCRGKNIDTIVSHSNGCLVTQGAFKLGLEVENWFAFAGACTSDKMTYPERAFDFAYVIYNPYDFAIRVGALLPFHPFGRLGSRGYREDPTGSADVRLNNINGASKGWGINHSHYWKSERKQWVDLMLQNIEDPLSKMGIDR